MKSTVLELIHGLTKSSMWESGFQTKCKVKDISSGRMEKSTRVNFILIKGMVSVNFSGKTVGITKEAGLTASSTAMENLDKLTAQF